MQAIASKIADGTVKEYGTWQLLIDIITQVSNRPKVHIEPRGILLPVSLKQKDLDINLNTTVSNQSSRLHSSNQPFASSGSPIYNAISS